MASVFDGSSVASLGDALSRVPDAFVAIPDIVRNPSADPVRASIVLGMGLALALILLVTIALFFIQPRMPYEYLGETPEIVDDPRSRPKRARRRTLWDLAGDIGTVLAALVVGVVVVWMMLGSTTGRVDSCSECHESSIHSTAPATDPHQTVACVLCHEPGGSLARVTANLPARVRHYWDGALNPAKARGYGTTISSIGCRDCHLADLEKVRTDEKRGIRISHREPLEAGAECTDCHQLQDGQVMAWTAGMEACLRCHDGKTARSACSTCHTGDPAKAIVPTTPRKSLASRLVPNPRCDSCHRDQSRCDKCHGLRMPHTEVFKAYAHARDGALDIWDTGGRLCRKCHTQERRGCMRDGCHTYKFPQHALSWKEQHQQAAWSQADSICGCHEWSARQHEGMNLCQVCHATKPRGTSP